MDDLDPVGVVDENAFPIFPAHDLFIQLDRDAFRRQRKFFKQLYEINLFCDFARFAINKNFHAFDFTKSKIQNLKSKIKIV